LSTEINIEISCGELIDKLTILAIKLEKIKDDEKLSNVKHEYEILKNISNNLRNIDHKMFDSFYDELKTINEDLWSIEDNIRKHEKEKNFEKSFIELARSVYKTNDKRFEIKSKINEHFGSEFFEEKQYVDYE